MSESLQRKPLMGILVLPPDIKEGPMRGEEHEYYLVIGEYRRGQHKEGILFISNPAIRKKIDEEHLRRGQYVGYVNVTVQHAFKRIFSTEYKPIGNPPIPAFEKLGIGDFFDLLIEKKYAKLYPHYTTSGTMEDSRERTRQLRKRGRDPTIETLLPAAFQQTRRKVIQNHRKNRRAA